METMSVRVRGIVQGVGFRYAASGKIAQLGLDGRAENLSDGSVRITAQGEEVALDELLAWLNSALTPGRVRDVTVEGRG